MGLYSAQQLRVLTSMTKLSSALVLNKYILSLFGVKDLEALSQDLKDSAFEGYDENNVSHFHHALVSRFYANPNLSRELLFHYDQNIFSHTKTISEKRVEPIRWKYFQYLALLFTEIYLDRYFENKEALRRELNDFFHGKFLTDKGAFSGLAPYKLDLMENDLNKVAYWSATGSGKTLLMHVNILQYQYYLKSKGKLRDLNRIIVLTPNEGLSMQHVKEFGQSGLPAELFDKNAGTLFQGSKIEIIDIHKLEEQSGDKTVALESFEGNNLVLVDEGHRGSGGEKWKAKRDRLCENGFSFEYSATFGQAVAAIGNAKQQKALIDEYGKATLFDYSYRYFYNDGYGKDYQILNLSENWNEGYVNLYLTACLLSFYEQRLIFRDHGRQIEPFLIEKPLAIFVGGKVTKSVSKEIASDVIEVLKFFEAFVRNPTDSIDKIDRILSGRDGLNDNHGHPIFRNSFKELRKKGLTPSSVFNDVLIEIFNSNMSGAFLHLDNLKGQDGEIGLRIGDGDYFGVINVGDDSKLLKLCEEHGLSTADKEFSESLFHLINSKNSTVNILIGSKKFTEGWSSWRVSTMGLLNIGRGEGSEIIQLFGRGVRLKGYKMSLKRSTSLDFSILPEFIPPVLPILETLNIFGIRADYMQQFREYLEEEGMPSENDYEKFTIDILPTIENLSEKKLKYLRGKPGANFKRSETVTIKLKEKKPKVTLDWYPKVQILKSAKNADVSTIVDSETGELLPEHTAFFSWDEIYFELQKYKNERSWHNLDLTREDVKLILADSSWYTLYIPKEELKHKNFDQVNGWQEIAISLLKMYCERLYNTQKGRYFSENQETVYVDPSDQNFINEYNILVKKSETKIIEKIQELKEVIASKEFKNLQIGTDFHSLFSQQHLYFPLLHIDKNRYRETVRIQPVALNKGEKHFVEDLKAFHEKNAQYFDDRELYLLRNLSRKGIGFFEANNFYPDFILWVVRGTKQYVNFIDPKGLRQVQGMLDDKIQLHKKIKTTIQQKLGDPNIDLHSFIVSVTPFEQISHWKGQESIDDFNGNNVFFQKEQREEYIKLILESAQVSIY
jgi:hypothetical protein